MKIDFLVESMIYENMESRLVFLAKQYDQKLMDAYRKDMNAVNEYNFETAYDVVKKLSEADPNPHGKSLNFIVNMYTQNEFLIEDVNRIKKELEKFYKFQNKIDNKNLLSYRSLNELYDVLDAIDDGEEKESQKTDKEIKKQEAEYIINTPNFKALIPHTYEANCIYGKGTRWCTTSIETSKHFDQYKSRGNLYIIIAKLKGKIRKFQFHVETGEFKNERDLDISDNDIKELSKIDEYKEFINYLINNNYKKYL